MTMTVAEAKANLRLVLSANGRINPLTADEYVLKVAAADARIARRQLAAAEAAAAADELGRLYGMKESK